MSRLAPITDPNLLYGNGRGDDTGVYKIADNLAIVQTVDFFTPIVDDPYDFGRIAAANALSDLYCIGARPVTALNIVGFPSKVGLDIVAEILRGGGEGVTEAGAVVVGGHSIDDPEPKYGLAVTGLVDPSMMITNRGARPGMALALTKKIGTGIVNNIAKMRHTLAGKMTRKGLPDGVFEEAVASMKRLNKSAASVMIDYGVDAATDVTGFGLLGHARNLAEASGVRIVIDYGSVPTFDGIEPLAIPGTKGGGERNRKWIDPVTEWGALMDENKKMVLCDAQTSGGLLIAVEEERADGLVERLRSGGDESAAIVGRVDDGPAGTLRVDA